MDDSDDDSARIEMLQNEIEELEAALEQSQATKTLSVPQDELLTAHLLCENTQALVAAFKQDEQELQEEFGYQENWEEQVRALVALSGISFSNIRTGRIGLQGGLSKEMTLEATTSGIAFELTLVVQEGTKGSAKEHSKVSSARLTVPEEWRQELASLIDSARDNCAVTTILRGLCRYSQAAAERQRLFEYLKWQYPAWVLLPHGSVATSLLSVQPPARSKAPFVFDFVWKLKVLPTGQLVHETQLIPSVSRQFAECDDQHNVIEQMPIQFKHLVQAKGLQGALEIMLTLVSNADNI